MDNSASISADDVAAALIQLHPGLDQMQLHKLLYLVQAGSLAWFEKPAFTERIEAWQHGPVVRGIAGRYKSFGRNPIDKPVMGNAERLSDRTRWIVDRVLDEFGGMSGPQLARLVKEPGMPWKEARGPIPDSAHSDAEITPKIMLEWHRRYGVVRVVPTTAENELANRFLDGDNDALADLFEAATGVRPALS